MCTSVPESQSEITLTPQQARSVIDHFFSVDYDPEALRRAIARLSRDLDQMDE